MTSDFNSLNLGTNDNDWIPIGEKGGRFEFFKVRIYGTLHFVKRLSPEYSNDLLSTESLRKEYSIGYPLNHPNIVRYLQFDGRAVYEEYIDGDTLRSLIEKNDERLKNPEFIRKIGIQTLEALKYLHQNGILHLDLKPENIMITRVGDEVKITDFGCSVNAVNDSIPGYTQEYMAPEQFNSEVNASTDIYQLGRIMKELVEISGMERRWKKFIHKATANHPDNRFRNDEEALRSIPVNSLSKFRFIWIIMILIVMGGGIGIMLNRRTTPLEEKISAPSKEEPAVSSETFSDQNQLKTDPIQLKEDKTEPRPTPHVKLSEAEIEREINHLISEKLTALYSVEVTPIYKKMMKDKERGEVTYRDKDFVDAYLRAYDKLVAYGDELIEKYPAQQDFIEERVQKIFETKTVRMREKLYPPSNIIPSWERETEVTIKQDQL